jgi:hypothetical protein
MDGNHKTAGGYNSGVTGGLDSGIGGVGSDV